MEETIIRVTIFAVLVGSLYYLTVYHWRWKWYGSGGGRIMFGMGFGLFIASALSTVGETWPDWHYRPILRLIGWLCILLIVLTAGVAITVIKRPSVPRRDE